MTGLIPPEDLTSATEPAVNQPDVDAAADDIAAVRALIVQTHTDAVPELIGGVTVAELIASIAPAQDAYARIAARAAQTKPSTPAVPAGGTSPAPIDPARLPPAEKIKRGLSRRG